MSAKFLLVTAVLMSVAALIWGISLFIVVSSSGSWPLMHLMATLTFAALAVIYWMMYFRRKTSDVSGKE